MTAVADALKQGQSQLTLLREATTGSSAALTQIITSLKATAADTTLRKEWNCISAGPARPVRKKNQFRVRHEREVREKRLQTPPEEGRHVLDPPLPGTTFGERGRRVPHHVVTSVGFIPMLRYKIGRPPPWLRRIVRQKSQWMVRNLNRSDELEHQRRLGLVEDEWDRLLWEQARQENFVSAENQRNAKRNGLSVGEWDYDEMGKGTASYSFWPQYTRQLQYEAFLEKKWQNAIRGWELWQVVKREQWLADSEAIPYRLARAIDAAQRLQDDVQSWTLKNGITNSTTSFSLRPAESCKAMREEVLSRAPLNVPVEWSEVVVDKVRPSYLEKPPELQALQRRLRRYIDANGGADATEDWDTQSTRLPEDMAPLLSLSENASTRKMAGSTHPSLPEGHPRVRRRINGALL